MFRHNINKFTYFKTTLICRNQLVMNSHAGIGQSTAGIKKETASIEHLKIGIRWEITCI